MPNLYIIEQIWKKKILNDTGKISHKKAVEIAETEYEKFRIKQDRIYIYSIDEMCNKHLEGNNKNENSNNLRKFTI